MTILNKYFLLTVLLLVPFLSKGQKKLKRSESFFGFHFDFHATENDKALGGNFDEDLLDKFLWRTKPDYIQIDSKGHPGYSSYPTNVGFSAGSFVKDPMRIWRDITNKHNLPLYVHYSSLWDAKAISEFPEWGRINADGKRDSTKSAYGSDYLMKIMIPQIKEMIVGYGIDGAWIDGDCWSTGPDYSKDVIEGFLRESGNPEVPRNPDDGNYKNWLEYNRLVYKNFLKKYVDALHQFRPDFQIASNWAYSSMMPEKVNIDVDFLSGDVSGQNGVYSAAFQARCLALQGKPWDLMAWGFVPIDFMGGIHSPKSLVQLQQEAAEVMAMGGGFQVYFQQNRDASFKTLDTEAMVKLAEFCRERQPFCQNSEIIPQIGIWYSLEGWKKEYNGIYGWTSHMEGINNLFLDGQHGVEILMDHQIEERMSRYPLIVIPEWDAFNNEIKEQLLEHVAEGGKVLVIGAKAVKHFENQLEVTFVGKDTAAQVNIGGRSLGGIAGIKTQWQPVTAKPAALTIGQVYSQTDYRYATDFPVATINDYGKGKIAALYLDMSSAYNLHRNPIFNQVINRLVGAMIPESSIVVSGSELVHVVLGKNRGNILIHLINSSGDHFNRNVLAYNELLPTPALTVKFKVDKRPKAVKLQPLDKKLKYRYRDNLIEVKIPPVEVHSIIELVF